MTSAADRQPATTLEGVLDHVVYHSEETAWTVAKLAVPGQREPVTAVGKLLGVQPGETLRLVGRWVEDRKYGRQFQVDSYATVPPSTLVGIEKYLGSGLIRGIGKVMARRLVAKFGLDTLEVIEHQPERLTEVPSIGAKRSAQIRQAWQAQRQIQEVMVFLQGHGVATGHAVRIFKTYGDEALAVLQDNPYRLAREVFGIGFQSADAIARNLGVAPDAPQRAEAGALHALAQAADQGHLFLPRDRLAAAAAQLLAVPQEAAATAIVRLAEAGEVVVEPRPGEEEPAVYLRPLHAAETGLAARLRALLQHPPLPLKIDVERALAWFEKGEGLDLAAEQRQAIRRSVAAKVLVITGGPGTGKTTLVRGIVRILKAKGRRVLLAAPTGRAAKRLAEATSAEASTLHRLLEFSPRTLSFEKGPASPLAADLLIVDEASMLDALLAYHVVRALPDGAQLILVGDVDQLPSVGPGRVLADLIDSGRVEVVRLTEIFRQAARSLIVVNAHRVNRGELPLTAAPEGEPDFFFIERRQPEEILDTLRHLVCERIPSSFGLDRVEEIQTLTPMNRGPLGTANLNEVLRQDLNPHGQAVTRGGRTLRVGDKVMQVRNNYELEVFNGDIGRVAAVDGEGQEVAVVFDGRRVVYAFSDLDELVLAYACTIHKAQGSEYPCVVVPLSSQHYIMLQRNLLYTALTRARRLAILVGERKALAVAVAGRDVERRFTLLDRFLAAPPGAVRLAPPRVGKAVGEPEADR